MLELVKKINNAIINKLDKAVIDKLIDDLRGEYQLNQSRIEAETGSEDIHYRQIMSHLLSTFYCLRHREELRLISNVSIEKNKAICEANEKYFAATVSEMLSEVKHT